MRKEKIDNIEKITRKMRELRERHAGSGGGAVESGASVDGFQQRYARTRILLKQRELVEHMQHEGLLIDLDAAPITAAIEERLKSNMLGRRLPVSGEAAHVLERVGDLGHRAHELADRVGDQVAAVGHRAHGLAAAGRHSKSSRSKAPAAAWPAPVHV